MVEAWTMQTLASISMVELQTSRGGDSDLRPLSLDLGDTLLHTPHRQRTRDEEGLRLPRGQVAPALSSGGAQGRGRQSHPKNAASFPEQVAPCGRGAHLAELDELLVGHAQVALPRHCHNGGRGAHTAAAR